MMESLALLEDLRKLPVGDEAEGYSHETAVSKLRGTDKDTFALGVAQAAEEVLEAFYRFGNVRDVLKEAHARAFTDVSKTQSLHEHYAERLDSGEQSLGGFISNLKGKVAELESVERLEERFPGYNFEVAQNPNQEVWDVIGKGPEGAEDVLVQVKVGELDYTRDVIQSMEEAPEHVYFELSKELHAKVLELQPDAADRLLNSGIEITPFTEDVESGLGTLANNSGIDVPDSIGEMLPYVGEVVLGIRLIAQMVSTEGELTGVEVSERTRIHAIRTLTMMSRFGVTQVCAWAGGAAGGAAGTTVAPAVGTLAGSAAGAIGGAGAAMLLNRLLEPRMEDVAIRIMGGDREEVFYLMNKSAIDGVGSSLAATSVA